MNVSPITIAPESGPAMPRGGSRTDEGSDRPFESVVAEVSQEGADSERASDESEAMDNRPDTPEGTGGETAGAANADMRPAANASTAGALRRSGGSTRAAPVQQAPAAASDAPGSATLVDAGRAAAASAAIPAATDGAALMQGSAGAGTLDRAPWFAVRAEGAEARGQALARAVQPALDDGVDLATRNSQRGATGGTMLGTAAEVQAMADGKTSVRAPDIVSRAVQHSAAQGAMAQAQRAQVDLPQQALDMDTMPPASESVAEGVSNPSEDGEPVLPTRPAVGESTARAPAAGARAMTGPATPVVGEPVSPVVGAGVSAAPDGVQPATVGGSPASAAAAEAALSAGRPTEAQLGQVAVPDADHMELKVSDGDHSFRLSVAREADGLNVELKAPREIVADLRALEPDVEAALAEDGYDLASFDAHEEDVDAEGGGGHAEDAEDGSDAVAGTDRSMSETERVPRAPAGQGRIINRLA